MSMEIRPLAGAVGAEIVGAEVARGLGNSEFASIRQAFLDHGMIVLRDQSLSSEAFVEFARRWGEINVNRFFRPVDGYPMIAEVRKEADQRDNVGGTWHADHSYDDAPALGSLLYAKELPPVGGDTLFASMSQAYEALSEGMRTMLEGLRAVHSSRHVFGTRADFHEGEDIGDRLGNPELATQDAVHPVVIRHPETGRIVLYVNPVFTTHIDGWTREESKPLLDFLYAHAQRPEFTCRLVWEEGSIGFWDNRAVWHLAMNDYHGHRRLMHRITIEGGPLAAASDSH